jgi:hypothetical protein
MFYTQRGSKGKANFYNFMLDSTNRNTSEKRAGPTSMVRGGTFEKNLPVPFALICTVQEIKKASQIP